jgi:uroporphyrinogen-III synthase
VRGEIARGDVAQHLAGYGFDVRSLTTYRIDAADVLPVRAKTALIEPTIDGTLFFSPRSASLFARLVDEAALGDRLSGLTALCLSPAIAECLDKDRWRMVRAAGSPDLAAVIALARDIKRPSNEIWPRAPEEPK